MPESISSKYELAYAFLLVLVNITSIEIFYRGYIQPRLEFLTMSIPGIIMTSLLAVLDFWELWVIQSPSILVVIRNCFRGYLYEDSISNLSSSCSFILYDDFDVWSINLGFYPFMTFFEYGTIRIIIDIAKPNRFFL